MIYTLGPQGTFSDKAAAAVAKHTSDTSPRTFLSDLSSVFAKTLADGDALGVIPVENSVAGTVHVVQDLLIRQPVWITHEVQVPVAFKMLVRGELRAVRRVFVHPVAERQCGESLRRYVPDAALVFTDSNTDSAARLFATDEQEVAAVVPLDYREAPSRAVRSVELQTAPDNATRFIAFKRPPLQLRPDFTREKISMLITPRANQPGVLYEILGSFQRHGMNLTRIESRPAAGPWEYVFLLDATITAGASLAWAELSAGSWDVRLLGCYSILCLR